MTRRTTIHVQRGFTLIEMLVSVAIFTTVMVVALGALLSLSEADRRAQTLNTLNNNLNAALDSMSRAIRTGTNYHCGTGTLTVPLDCSAANGNPNGGQLLSFLAADGTQVTYQQFTTGCTNGVGCIQRSVNGGPFIPLTTPEVFVTTMQFYVVGAPPGDGIQPKVTMRISGYIQITPTQTSVFNLQTTVTQRLYDQ